MADKTHLYVRTLEPALKTALADTPVVCLLGPRQCGKTTLTKQVSADRAFISLDEDNYFKTASADPSGFVNSLPEFVTIDEVQRVPALLPAIKYAVDQNRTPGRFLLTGSANLLLLPKVTESLAGRMETVYLNPLTESEKERKPGTFLKNLIENTFRPAISGASRDVGLELPERLVAGGYPEPLTRTPQRARQWHHQYLKSIIERDVQDIARIKDGHELERLLERLALHPAGLMNINGLAQELGLYRTTVEQYLLLLERLFLVRRLPAWHRNAAKRLVKAPKIHLIDSGLAASLASLTAQDWNEKREQMGHLLESFTVQQIIAQAAWTNSDLRFWHYRDKDKVEVDLVITLGRKTWGIEVKASASAGAGDTKGLTRLADQCGSDFQSGIVLYNGNDIMPLGNSPFLALPFRLLWEL
jgi:predicted AAA+ superfamily ATPase